MRALIPSSLVLVAACSSDPAPARCVPGRVGDAPCGSSQGSQVCQADGTYGSCTCPDGGPGDAPGIDAPAPLDSGAPMDSLVTPDTSLVIDTGVRSDTSGRPDTGSPPDTGVDAGAGRTWGVPVVGNGRANWHYLQYSGYRWGTRFVPGTSGTVDRLAIPWRSVGTGYGAGDGGSFRVEVRTDDPRTHFPGDTVLATASDQRPGPALDGYWEVPVTFAALAGAGFHLVVVNTHPDARANWSSSNTLMSEVFPWPEGPGPRGEVFVDGAWSPWVSTTSEWATRNEENGSHIALLWHLRDMDRWEGLPYQSAASSSGGSPFLVYGARAFGEQFVHEGGDATVRRVAASFKRVGSPTGDLVYHLQRVSDGAELATGVLCRPTGVDTGHQGWCEAGLATPVRLVAGTSYRFYVDAPHGTDASNHYLQRLVYTFGETRAIGLTFGGATGQAVYQVGSGWTMSGSAYDFGFLLRE